MSERVSIVVTSIFAPNDCLKELAKGAEQNNWDLIIIGDLKSPTDFVLKGSQFLNLEMQNKLNFRLAKLCPVNHYTRKNVGYLLAMKDQSSIIIETDDDNSPTEAFWSPRRTNLHAISIEGTGWFNVYSLYSDKDVWPRGLPLENVRQRDNVSVDGNIKQYFSPIQQGLADGNPDVDAVFRMTQSLPITFNKRNYAVLLSKGVWSPFNSQNTTWHKEAFPLLYLPSYCTFRMTDIWRGFVAQRIAWECNWNLIFHDATVFQERNEHNLLRDFEQEIPGYLLNNKIRTVLEDTHLRSGYEFIGYNMRACYQTLIRENIITSEKELDLLEAWLEDIEKILS